MYFFCHLLDTLLCHKYVLGHVPPETRPIAKLVRIRERQCVFFPTLLKRMEKNTTSTSRSTLLVGNCIHIASCRLKSFLRTLLIVNLELRTNVFTCDETVTNHGPNACHAKTQILNLILLKWFKIRLRIATRNMLGKI